MKDAILSGQVHVDISSQDDPFTRKNARMKVSKLLYLQFHQFDSEYRPSECSNKYDNLAN